ncbi:hypothetical protein [Ruegeria lacuscaerulensis]|uniref:hypothetical protein n=2 Tax=Ruegeria lacuscaerulensis TaxID=55218 RepID=UPI0030136BF2
MRPVLKYLLPYMLSLLVVLTGQSVAASRGVDAAVGQMVLCTGTGPVVVYMDAEGQPTQPPHYCPDYALTLLGAIDAPHVDVPPAPRPKVAVPARTRGNLIAAPRPHHPARAPPARI